MTPEQITGLGLLLTWSVIWIRAVVSPYGDKDEALTKDFVTSGVLDAAYSHIESQRLLPALAKIYRLARDQQEDKRRVVDVEALLAGAEFIDEIEEVEEAMREKRALDDGFSRLCVLSGRAWGSAMGHILVTALVGAWQTNLCSFRSLPLLILGIAVSVLLFAFMLWNVMRYRKTMKNFTLAIREHRGGGGND